MATMETLIGDLLLRHNCVIVPSFGGFVAKQVSAQIDFVTGKMSPPRKSLLFNKQLLNNDGLLINEYARTNRLSFDAASDMLKKKIADWNRVLASGGRIELDRVGFIYFDEEKNICFEQDRYFNLLMASFGLGQVHFVSDVAVREEQRIIDVESRKESLIDTVKAERVIEIAPKIVEKVSAPKLVNHPAIEKERSHIWKYIAAACFLPIAFYSVWIPMKTDVLESGVISINDFNPFKKRGEARFQPSKIKEIQVLPKSEAPLTEKIEEISTNVDVYTYKFDEDFFVPVAIKEPKTLNEPNGPQENFEVENVHYIVGCFASKENANNLVERLKTVGLEARIVDVHNGLHRVSAGGAISEEGLQHIKMTASSISLSGWVLKN
jgi:hypothetical protein